MFAKTDLDGNGVNDLIVGANLDDDGGSSVGAVYVLFLEASCPTMAPTPVPTPSPTVECDAGKDPFSSMHDVSPFGPYVLLVAQVTIPIGA